MENVKLNIMSMTKGHRVCHTSHDEARTLQAYLVFKVTSFNSV